MDQTQWENIDKKRYAFWIVTLTSLPIYTLYPFRLIKTRMQTVRLYDFYAHYDQTHFFDPDYNSTGKAIRAITKNEGINGLWKGSSIFCTGIVVTGVLRFTSYEYIKTRVSPYKDTIGLYYWRKDLI